MSNRNPICPYCGFQSKWGPLNGPFVDGQQTDIDCPICKETYEATAVVVTTWADVRKKEGVRLPRTRGD